MTAAPPGALTTLPDAVNVLQAAASSTAPLPGPRLWPHQPPHQQAACPSPEDLAAMGVRQLRALLVELVERGGDPGGCLDKADLVRAVRAPWQQ